MKLGPITNSVRQQQLIISLVLMTYLGKSLKNKQIKYIFILFMKNTRIENLCCEWDLLQDSYIIKSNFCATLKQKPNYLSNLWLYGLTNYINSIKSHIVRQGEK